MPPRRTSPHPTGYVMLQADTAVVAWVAERRSRALRCTGAFTSSTVDPDGVETVAVADLTIGGFDPGPASRALLEGWERHRTPLHVELTATRRSGTLDPRDLTLLLRDPDGNRIELDTRR